MDLIKFNKITDLCNEVAVTINKVAVNPTAKVSPEEILNTPMLYAAFGHDGLEHAVKSKMILTNTVVSMAINLKQQQGNVTLMDTYHTLSSYSLEHVVEEMYGLLELFGLV